MVINAALSRSTGLLLSCFLAAACTDTMLYSSHEPMHPITDYVYLKAEATGSIDRIELWLRRFDIVPDGAGKYKEVADGAKYMVWFCDPASYVSPLKCAYRQAFSGHHKMIEFEARAFYRNGVKRSETYRIASGRFIDADLPISIRTTGAPVESLDIVIVPDADLFGDVNGFRYFLDDMIDGMFFDYSALRNCRNLYNFYYTMQPGSCTSTAQGCVFTLPQNIADIEAAAGPRELAGCWYVTCMTIGRVPRPAVSRHG